LIRDAIRVAPQEISSFAFLDNGIGDGNIPIKRNYGVGTIPYFPRSRISSPPWRTIETHEQDSIAIFRGIHELTLDRSEFGCTFFASFRRRFAP
jgi:hypothetical protein